jgi:hypothetical protein
MDDDNWHVPQRTKQETLEKHKSRFKEIRESMFTENIPFFDQIPHDTLEEILSKTHYERFEKYCDKPLTPETYVPTDLGMGCLADLKRTYVFSILNASAILQKRFEIGPSAQMLYGEFGSGSGINCLIAHHIDSNIKTIGFEKSEQSIDFSRKILEPFKEKSEIIQCDFFKVDLEKYKFDIIFNENIHMGSFQEPFFELAVYVKPHATESAIMVPQQFIVGYADKYHIPKKKVAVLDMLNIPPDLTFRTHHEELPPERVHLFFDLSIQEKPIFKKHVSYSQLVLSHIQPVFYDESPNQFVNKEQNTYFRIVLRREVEVEGYVSTFAESFIMRRLNQQ